MRMHKSSQEILNQNHLILGNISQTTKDAQINKLRAKGNVLFSEAADKGFKKVGWDVYQRPEDIDAGNIWSVENLEGDKWLVCYTDANDHILRNLSKEAYNYRMDKTAEKVEAASIEPVLGWGLQPGALVEITPQHFQSINSKHGELKGIVTSAFPDRTELTFDDGSSMWFENKDLTPIVDATEMRIKDDVRMFANNISGKVTKISHDGNYITFKHNETGQLFTSRKNELKKIAFTFMWSGDTPDDIKASEKALSNFFKTQTPQAPEAPGDMGGGMDLKSKPDTGPPPSIKQNPSAQELSQGTSVPAADIGGGSFTGEAPQNTPPAVGEMLPMSASDNSLKKTGRRMNVGDTVQKKSTGQKGTIVDVSFDRKLGKFYLIDFGEQAPEQVYETELMKMKDPGAETASLFPSEVTPGPTRLIGASVKEAIIDPTYTPIKEAAMEFVQGMVGQALTIHESQNPGSKPPPQLEDALTRQAVSLFMSKYLPEEIRQVMGTTEKNELSEWLMFEVAGTDEDTPSAQEFVDDSNTSVPAQKTEIELTQDNIQAHIESHIKFAKYSPSKFASPIERNRFTQQAMNILTSAGIDSNTARLVISATIAHGDVDSAYLLHQLSRQFGYSKKASFDILEETKYQLATTLFTTSQNQKYALDLPGMETLRGGGGGYPGGMDVDPMGWDVQSPQVTKEDPNVLQQSLEEQLMDQSKPFEEAVPKLNIELDQQNKKIVIDYNQDEEPIMPLEGAGQEGAIPGLESPNMPSPSGPAGPKPGDTQGPGGNNSDFSNQDVPVNF